MHAAEKGYQYVRVKTPGSDILWTLMFHANKMKATVLYETGHRNKKTVEHNWTFSTLCKQVDAVLGLHAFKVKPLKKMLQSPTFYHALSQLGNSWTLSPGLVTGLGLFQKKCVGGGGWTAKFFCPQCGCALELSESGGWRKKWTEDVMEVGCWHSLRINQFERHVQLSRFNNIFLFVDTTPIYHGPVARSYSDRIVLLVIAEATCYYAPRYQAPICSYEVRQFCPNMTKQHGSSSL